MERVGGRVCSLKCVDFFYIAAKLGKKNGYKDFSAPSAASFISNFQRARKLNLVVVKRDLAAGHPFKISTCPDSALFEVGSRHLRKELILLGESHCL